MPMRDVIKTTFIHLSVQLGSGVAALVLPLLLTLTSQPFLFGFSCGNRNEIELNVALFHLDSWLILFSKKVWENKVKINEVTFNKKLLSHRGLRCYCLRNGFCFFDSLYYICWVLDVLDVP